MTAPTQTGPPVWNHGAVSEDLSAWAQQWRAATGRSPLVLVSHGRPEYGLAPADAAVWSFVAEQLRSCLGEGEHFDFVVRIRGGNLAYLRDVIEAIAQDSTRSIRRSVVLDWATSAGAILALACGQVAMSSNSYLSPIAPQISQGPEAFPPGAADLARLIGDNPWLVSFSMAEIRPLALAVQWQAEIERWLERLGSVFGWDAGESAALRAALLDPTVPHDGHVYPCDVPEARSLLGRTTTTEEGLLSRLRSVLKTQSWEVTESGLLLHTMLVGEAVYRYCMPASDTALGPEA
ncbi:MAG: hypothetical protein R2706_05325 [Acidimicrobiales bacterium]